MSTSIRQALGELKRQRLAEQAAAAVPPPVPAPARPASGQRKPRPSRPVDELRRFFPDQTATYVTIGASPREPLDAAAVGPYEAAGTAPRTAPLHSIIKDAKPGPRGPEAIVKYLAGRGITLIATGDGEFAVTSEAGRLDLATRDAIEAARPLLRACLHGTPLRCALPSHTGGEPPLAVTLALGGAAMCAECGR